EYSNTKDIILFCQAKNISVSTKNSPLLLISPMLISCTERCFKNLLPERQNLRFNNNSQYISDQTQNYSKLTSSNSLSTSFYLGSDFMKSNNNNLSDYDSEDHEYIGEQNIIKYKLNIDQSKEESSIYMNPM
ncbi:28858_t:CDS:2, partial [Racocetra persica]